MPQSPVSRPHASAMWTAAASWRTCTRSSFASIAASKIDMMWLPESVNTRDAPRRSSERATMSAPRSALPSAMRCLSESFEGVVDVLGLVVRRTNVSVERADHAAYVAAVHVIDVLVAPQVVRGVAGAQHIGVGE